MRAGSANGDAANMSPIGGQQCADKFPTSGPSGDKAIVIPSQVRAGVSARPTERG